MARQFSTAVRTARATAIETTIGTTPKLQLRSGSVPANCAAAATGDLLCEIDLPSDWVTESGGVLTKAGTWEDVGVAAGSIGHYRMLDSAGTTCHEQGTVTTTGGGGDMTVDNVVVAVDQPVTVTAWESTEGGA